MAGVHVGEKSLEETQRSSSGVGTVVLAHNDLDGVRCLVCVIEGNGADIVVQNVGFDNPVEELTTNETKFTIDGGRSATGVGPRRGRVVGKRGVGVLKESDGNCISISR